MPPMIQLQRSSPAVTPGCGEEARRLVHPLCKTWEPYRWIVGPPGSCTAMCRVFFGHVDPDPRIVEIGRRVCELTEFLVNVLGVTDTGASYHRKGTLHNGCHTRRELGVGAPPVALLEKVRGLEYRELPNVEECCGFGGTFSV